MPRFTVADFVVSCGCRSAGECDHNAFAEVHALDALVHAYRRYTGLDEGFAVQMQRKLREKYFRDGYTGWDDPANELCIRESLARHEAKGDPVDVANLKAFLWNFAPLPPGPDGREGERSGQ